VACGPLSPHCFYGIDSEVVSAIANFIMASPLTTTTSAISTTTTTTTQELCLFETIYGIDSDEVARLRFFRDKALIKLPAGRKITKLYYQLHDLISEAIKHEGFKKEVKAFFNVILSLLKKMTL
jgi:hypothetical protein